MIAKNLKIITLLVAFLLILANVTPATSFAADPVPAGAELDENNADITILQWVDPEGRQPMTYEEFTQGLPPQEPLAIKRICGTSLVPSEKRSPSASLVLVIVNSSLQPDIQGSLDQYVSDLENEGYSVTVYATSGGTPSDLRAYLQGELSNGLVGCLLVGDLPVPWYEMDDDFSGYAQFPIDLYYMDLDGTWTDSDVDGLYDGHSDGGGDRYPDIWVGRLTVNTLSGNATALLQNYFEKNHAYRTGDIILNNRALVYVDDDWIPWADVWDADVGLAYDTRTLVKDGATTIASDYKDRLDDNYEWIQLCAHSSAWSHSFKIGNEWTGGSVSYTDIQSIDPVALFYNLFACSNCRYIETDYMGGWYVFANTYGLAAVGSTKTGGMLDFDKFYTPIGQGKSLGESFKEWFIAVGPYDLHDRQWHYGMTLLGDPTLSTQPYIDLGEAVDNTGLTWTTDGNANWFGQTSTYYYGGDAAQSGAITHNQVTWLRTTVTGPGSLSFYWKVSSESNFDFLRFYIDGVEQTRISGSIDWQQKSYSISSGTHNLEWRYTKDGSVNSGSDCGWVDKIELPTITVTSPSGGETWVAGSTQTIRWTYTGNPGAYVKIELFKGEVLNRTISSSMSIGTGGSGSYSWAIPSTQISGTDYRVKITSTTNAAYTDTSNADFTIIGPPPSAPTLKSPASASTVPSLMPRLEWNASSGAVSYGVQVSTSSSFTNLIVNETGITDLYYDIAPGILNWNTTYYWRVNARNSFGSTSSWSTSRYFKTAVGPPPNAPSNLIATPISSSQINLSWQDNSGDETGFKIERKTGSGSYSQIATVGAGVINYSNTGLTASTTYYYRVRAYNAAGNSDYSNEASATTLPPPPSAPTLKSPASASTVSSLTPRLEWNASSGAVSYGVQVSTSSSFTSLLVNEVGITTLYYDIALGILKWNTTYYWRVNARNSFGSTSSWSSSRYFKTAVGPPPNAPSNLVATPISSSQINLTWQDNSGDETGFKIERKTGSGSYSQIATVGANVTSYSNTFLNAGTTYYYRVRAYNAAGNSNYSNEASATTLPPPPPAPTLKSPASASTVSSLTPRLEWNASSGATDYGLQVATTSSFATLLVNETGIANLYYDIASGILKWNTTYYWRVNAKNSFGSTSSWSTSRYFKTAVGPPPNAPSNLIATPISSSQINLTWQDNSGDETGFKIERKTGSGSYFQIATVGANVTSYSNTFLSAGTTYYYRVRAYKGTLNSDYCKEASATTLPPAAPLLKSPTSGSTISTLTPRLDPNNLADC